MGSKYLLRFDDCCPTMNWGVWAQVEKTLLEFNVKPILSVVPDNQDEKLKVFEPNKRFWNEVREWQNRSWTIGLHGYQHLLASFDAGIIGINRFSEFSGLSFHEQLDKIRRSLEIFQREGVRPDVWVAPAHSFDETTLQALSELGIRCVSDGFSLYPHSDSRGMLWMPQQLWRFRKMPIGIWTVCLHVNHWTAGEVAQFRCDLRRFAALLTDWPSAIAAYQDRKQTLTDAVFSRGYRIAVRGRQWIRHMNSAEKSLQCSFYI